MSRLVLILGDQLSPEISSLAQASKAHDRVVMAEVGAEASYVKHHPKKIAFLFAAMRKFADALRADGWEVAYTKFDDPDNSGTLEGELLRRASAFDLDSVLVTEPGEWRLIEAFNAMELPVEQLSDTRFLATHSDFEEWAEGRKELRMEWFYREMRRKTGLLMDGDEPEGGKWNFDHDNRKSAPKSVSYPGPKPFEPDETVSDVLDMVEAQFEDHFGTLRPFSFATDAAQAQEHLEHWITHALPLFGDFQDAMLNDNRFLYHSVIGLYLNAGLLEPLKTCRAVEKAYRDGHAPINAAEGFIRQIIGWREYIRGIYFREGPDYTARNGLDHQRDLPAFFWGGETRMNCISKSIEQTRDEAYAHHIQRLMVTGNFALLAGIAPAQVHEWYLAVYADAYEWVEAPNVIGMSQFADGGIIASKPYVSSGNYIHKMSDYCKSCHYKVTDKTGETACPFNLLYWDFLTRHRERFSQNPRMGNMYRVWDRMDETRQKDVLEGAAQILSRLDSGEII